MSDPRLLVALIFELPYLPQHVDLGLERLGDSGPEVLLADVAVVVEPHNICVVRKMVEHVPHHRILERVLVGRVQVDWVLVDVGLG